METATATRLPLSVRIMGRAKEIRIAPISSKDASLIVKKIHYSGKVAPNSQLHLGVFLDGKCGGAMQFGPSLDKRKLIGLVSGTKWNEFMELNRMAFSDWLPRNSESRALSVAFRWMRKKYPHIKWIVSFADAAQCGDGAIYRASGFALTGIRKNNAIWKHPGSDSTVSDIGIKSATESQKRKILKTICRTTVTKGAHAMASGGGASMSAFKDAGFKPLKGFQLRYLYFLDKSCRKNLTVPILPFSEIDRVGARMYKGKSLASKA